MQWIWQNSTIMSCVSSHGFRNDLSIPGGKIPWSSWYSLQMRACLKWFSSLRAGVGPFRKVVFKSLSHHKVHVCSWHIENVRYTVNQAHLSSVIECICITFAVPGEPRDVFARPINSSTIEVRWSPPDDSDKNGQIRGYQIYVQPRNVGVCHSKNCRYVRATLCGVN